MPLSNRHWHWAKALLLGTVEVCGMGIARLLTGAQKLAVQWVSHGARGRAERTVTATIIIAISPLVGTLSFLKIRQHRLVIPAGGAHL